MPFYSPCKHSTIYAQIQGLPNPFAHLLADRSPDNAHERWTGIDFATGIPIHAMGLGVSNYRTTMSPSLLEVLPKPASDAASYSVFCTGHL